jgi:endonuclease III
LAKEIDPFENTEGSQELKARAARVARRLSREYGSPNLNNKADPFDELVFIILSQMTTGPSYERVYDRVRARFNSWNELLLVPPGELVSLIADAGLSRQKAPRLIAIARRLQRDFEEVSLRRLEGATDRVAESYLLSLPGVGVKTAKCVMMYALGRRVLPVDTHVRRVARRLGLVGDSTGASAHLELERAVRPSLRYGFHVNALVHGRRVCRARRPLCSECVLNDMCAFSSPQTTQLISASRATRFDRATGRSLRASATTTQRVDAHDSAQPGR